MYINSNLAPTEALRVHGDAIPEGLRQMVEDVAEQAERVEELEQRGYDLEQIIDSADSNAAIIADTLDDICADIEDGKYEARTKAERAEQFKELADRLREEIRSLRDIDFSLPA